MHLSMGRFGYVEAMVVDDRTGKLVAGHGRAETLAMMRRDGKPPPEGVVVAPDGRWMVPVQRGWASKDDDEAKAYVIASNALPEKGGWLEDVRARQLEELAVKGKLDGTGYDGDDVEKMLQQLAGEPPPAFEPPGEQYQVVIVCTSEQQQVELLERLTREGLKVRALVG